MTLDFTQGAAEEKPPTFGDVEEDQFFVDEDGDLCQKLDGGRALRIAGYDGEPNALLMDLRSSFEIKRVLPHIDKIKF